MQFPEFIDLLLQVPLHSKPNQTETTTWLFSLYPCIISIDRKRLLQQMDRKVNHNGAHLECRWMGNELQCYNRPIRVKLFYHAKESGLETTETPEGIALHSAFS